MKIKIARFYQAISIYDGSKWHSAITHLNIEDPRRSFGDISMSLEPGVGLRIETPADVVLVTFNNIASMHPIVEPKKSGKDKDKAPGKQE